jgi:hypothetical protein
MAFDEHRLIDTLNDSELEDLIKKWISQMRSDYFDFERPTASADMGRDAVGFLSEQRYDGEWHNYQCKHLKKPLGTSAFAVELGKIFHYACSGEFTVPTKYIFVAPKSGVRDVKKMIDLPSKIGPFLIANWDRYCLNDITSDPCPMTDKIRSEIESYPFENVELWKSTELVERPHMRAVMHEHMDIDPGEAPRVREADVPTTLPSDEIRYVSQLVKVFGQDNGTPFADHDAVMLSAVYGPQLKLARQRYLEREAFRRHFRDNLLAKHIDGVDEDVHATVVDRFHAMRRDPLYNRLVELMALAATAPSTGPLGRHNRVTPSVKQGSCHHFANINRLPWA